MRPVDDLWMTCVLFVDASERSCGSGSDSSASTCVRRVLLRWMCFPNETSFVWAPSDLMTPPCCITHVFIDMNRRCPSSCGLLGRLNLSLSSVFLLSDGRNFVKNLRMDFFGFSHVTSSIVLRTRIVLVHLWCQLCQPLQERASKSSHKIFRAPRE
jgi:hypothetical protein